MKCSYKTIFLAFIFFLIYASANASGHEGVYGYFIAIYSIPVAIGALFVTAILLALNLFKNKGFFYFYCFVFIIAGLVAIVISLSADLASGCIVAFGESIMFLPILFQAYKQYRDSVKQIIETQKSSNSDNSVQ